MLEMPPPTPGPVIFEDFRKETDIGSIRPFHFGEGKRNIG